MQVHACHGPARQVEVLREVLLGLLQDDPTLEPRDVLVLCPDVETYAPLVSAAFGLADGTSGRAEDAPGCGLRVRLADRSLRRTNPLLDTVAALLELAGSRVTAGAVLDLAASGPVRRQFGFDDEELERLRDWVAGSGVRWGLDASGRAPYGLSALPQNTWASGLDRLLLGVTTAEDEPVWLGRRSRWTTSTAATSTWQAGWPSSSTGSRRCCTGCRAGNPRPAGRPRWWTGWSASRRPATPTPGSWGRCGPSWPTPCTAPAATCGCPTYGRCSPTGCAGDPPARTSGPAA